MTAPPNNTRWPFFAPAGGQNVNKHGAKRTLDACNNSCNGAGGGGGDGVRKVALSTFFVYTSENSACVYATISCLDDNVQNDAGSFDIETGFSGG